MGKKEFKVFATDGENTWEIFYVTQNPKGDFYYSVIDPDFGKFSRHTSGQSHYKGKSSYRRLNDGQPLSDFKGIEEFQLRVKIGTAVLGGPTTKLRVPRNIERSMIIDARKFVRPYRIGIRIYLIEARDNDEMQTLIKLLPSDSESKIFYETIPWLMIVAYPSILD